MATSQEREDERYDWSEHYRKLFERAQAEADWNKARLFDAWRTMAGQTRGLQRQRRIINRLRIEIKAAKTTGPRNPNE